MIIICGATIAEVERDLEMAKQAIASGMPYGVGGATIEDAEKGLEMMRAVCGEQNAPISNPNYEPPCGLMSCDDCNYDHCPCEDEEDDTCPECGATYDWGWDGHCCEVCDYSECDKEDEPPIVTALADMLRSLGVDEATIGKLMQSALGL
jgi:PHP family Zn ribbon phosphoesterase